MANLAETIAYDAGVYQLETTDPVQGGASGVSNTPLKNLANRTAWLKQQVDSLAASVAARATTNDAALTGSPTAPTAPLGDNDTSIATTAFVQGTVGGRLVKNIPGAGGATLTAVEAGNGILEFTGALTGNSTVTVPATPTRAWTVRNATSGSFTLTIKTPAGTGVVVTQGTTDGIYSDGTNVVRAKTGFPDAALTGAPTAPTQTAGDASALIASTAFVAVAVTAAVGWSTGDVKATFKTVADTGWVLANDGSIGQAGSGATTRANNDTQALFYLLWNNIPSLAVSGGRGASAAADWAANKALALPAALGRAMSAAGAGSGLTARALGTTVGAETHTLSWNEMPSHNHGGATTFSGTHSHTGYTDAQGSHNHGGAQIPNQIGDTDRGTLGSNFSTDNQVTLPTDGNHAHNVQTNDAGLHSHGVYADGSYFAHNNMQPTFFVNFMVKL